MDVDSVEVSRERATSSEPISTRPHPFDDDMEESSRKRQRVSSVGSRSRSVDTVRTPIDTHDHINPDENDPEGDTTSLQPQTPSISSSNKLSAEPTSSKVTINLRMNRNLNSTSETPPSPQSPSKDAKDIQITGSRIDLDLTRQKENSTEPIEITSSSPSAAGSPKVELIIDDDDDATYRNISPAVAIIEDDQIVDDDPTLVFPYNDEAESLVTTVRKIARFFEYDNVETEEAFCKLRDWIYTYLRMSNDHERVWYENHEKHSDFWDHLPDIIWALSRRKSFFGQFLSKSTRGRRALSELFVQFARLTARFVAMDVRIFSKLNVENIDTEPPLFSRPYMSAFAYLFKKDESPHIGRNLDAHYRWTWDDDMILMINHFLNSGGNIPALIKLTQAQVSLLSRYPRMVDDLTEPGRIVTKAVGDAAFLLRDAGSPHQQHIEVAKRIVNQGYEYFQVMSDGLVRIIEKHVTFLNADAALSHIVGLTQLLNMALILDGSPASDLLDQHRQLYPDLPKLYTATVISTEWRFEMLKKLIVSGQMQLRVSGVTTLCQELLTMFTKHKREDTARHPLLLHFAHFILQNKLVDYIVGIDSHREIISESANIVGFLIATKTYTPQQTDTIWKTVMTSPDPRVVEAILRMLGQILNLYEYDALLYLCKKTGDLPLEAFTIPMREFCERLMFFLLNRATSEKIDCLDAPPFELFVRLMREASMPKPDAPVGALDIQIFASARLRELITHGPSSDIRNEIYISCIKDISERTPTASGSICALYILLHHSMAKDLHILTTNHGLTRLMIEEFDYAMQADLAASVPTNIKSPARQARRDLLLAIILHEPSTISPELGERLWGLFVGKEARSDADRDIAWQILNSAAKKISSRNIFIATCFKEYLPQLEPSCYTAGTLDFTREAIQASLRDAQGDLLDEDQAAHSHGIEQLWRMVLNAPEGTIEGAAINMLVELYVESQVAISMPRARANQLHLSVLNRCLKQLSSAAEKLRAFSDGTSSGDDEPMVIVASDEQVKEQEMHFTRSLLLLREFLRVYQSKSQFAPPKPRLPVFSTLNELRGEPLDLKYQAFDGDTCAEIKNLQIGDSNSLADFFGVVVQETGFKSFKAYHWGREIDLNPSVTQISIRDLQLGRGLILVVRRDEEEQDGKSKDISSNLEVEIVNHFDEFWDYLGMEEKLAKEIYYFLEKFPAYHKLLTAFDSESTSLSEVFTLGQPFKCLYAVYALREYLIVKAREGKADENTISRAIGLIVSAIVNPDVLESCTNAILRRLLAQSFVDFLIKFLPEPGVNSSLASHIHPALLGRLLQLLRDIGPKDEELVASIFEFILEASLHSPHFWTAFISSHDTPMLLRQFLLEDSRDNLRKSIMKQIIGKCSFTPSLSAVSSIDFAVAFWPLLKEMVPLAARKQGQCDEILSLTLLIFRKLADTSIDSVDLEECLLSWGGLLIAHKSNESVGHPERVDTIARGLTSLVYWCASFSKAATLPLSSRGLAVALFNKHMFPELSDDGGGGSIKENIPLLNQATRKHIAETVFFLTRNDREQYTEILHNLLGLLPYSLDEEIPYALELGFAFDRSKAIRSSTGYVGLRNLSNTCYLNSLFTQLFMNVSFRRFMLNANVAEGASQKLLYETQKLFAFMQNSFKRFIDPSSLAASIRTYDDTNIDVSVQMDVDEFYNLLFDRWESQILSPSDKRQFRSFYGGQLVQQVKSKECPHISERLEPFSAIQCDIKGKSTLQESLQAYVDGEAMEGDNKYKCSTCDRHVNAVKRACLKEVPDNLIFHLKRFDFNLRTMQRSKINDYFSFPHVIDMRPYKVEHLMETPDESPEDFFELVGILVHSGTAESGHYYSYIRERPSTDATPKWVEFNDDHVTPFDPASIEANCFGGVEYRGPETGSFSFDKSWSAYMLFYQRSSVLKRQQQSLMAASQSQPLRLPINRDLRSFIVTENELLVRKFCLYDENHAAFVLRMVDHVQSFNHGQCSEDHGLERLAMSVALTHLDQVIARTKDLPDFGDWMMTLCQKFQACSDCCRDFLEWLIDHQEAFRQLLFRNPDFSVRNEIVATVILALSKVKRHSTYDYGLYEDSDHQEDMDSDDFDSPRLYTHILETLHRFWESFHLSVRAWPEYFGLLSNMARLGVQETAQMLDAGFLRKVLEALTADSAFPPHPQYTRMLAIIQKRPTNRPVQLEQAIQLLEVLLGACDLSLEPIGVRDLRIELAVEDEALPINEDEHSLMIQHWTRSDINILVEKLLAYNQNEKSTLSIIRMMILGNFDEDAHGIFNAIKAAIRKGTSAASAPALRAALVYCQYMEDWNGIVKMIGHISNVTNALNNSEGKEHLRFFKDLLEIPNNNAGIDHDEFFRFALQQVPTWAPCLLMYYDPVVRADTEDYLQQVLIAHAAEPDPNTSSEAQQNSEAVLMVARSLGLACLSYLNHHHVEPRSQVVKASLLSIQAIIELCKPLYDELSDDEVDVQFRELYESVLPALKKLTVEEVDEDVSEWENSDDAFSSSEVMDSIAELCGTVGGELNDVDV